ncbi:MAG: response regulator transcription factor [Bryobacterales bacterium]|nr:response regulator transcription factor [Bryobacterales bacterium]
MIRVLLIEDHALIRRGIADLIDLTGDLKVVAQGEDGDDALRLLASAEADVALLDIQLPKLSGVEVLERLRQQGTPFPPALLLTTFDDDDMLLRGIRAGARGFLLKAVSFEDLAASIRAVAAGETAFKPAFTERVRRILQKEASPSSAAALVEALTRRETEILRLMAGGFSNREIGDLLDMSEGTVRNHGSAIFSKLAVRDRTRAVLKGIELGLV